jgi:pimeloyl-ACP methyl ester carboxylesterase
MRDFTDIPPEAIRSIAAPTLIMQGDADVVRPEHGVALMRLIPHARLAVLPSTDHMQMMQRSEALVPMIEEFLDVAADGQ